MQYPLVILALFFSLGVLLGNLIKLTFPWLYFFTCSFLAAYFLPPIKKIQVVLFCSLIMLCGAVMMRNASSLAANHISRFTYYKSENVVTLQGRIESPPEIKNSRTIFVLRAQEVGFKKEKIYCCGKILIRASAPLEVNYGDNVILRGRLCRLFSFGKNWDSYNKFLNRQGIYCQLFILPKSKIEKLRQNTVFSLKKISLELKTGLEKIIFRHCSQLSAAIVDAMVLGEKNYVPDRVYNTMIKTGTVHILVVSGFNVGIVGFLLFLLLKLGKVPRKPRILLTCVLLILYCFITGASNPVVRATIMGIIFLLSYLAERDADIYSSCAIAAIVILAINPSQLFDIGFQLSFLSVISIVYISPKLKSLFRLESV
ncbi:MAG: ComEC family competence protein, partial [Candidatus Omnitrophica bacterium]|nr:ComEC family competence protein [Candidatus Omnitrophota bacterium]